jgi:hypothetical protein
MQWYPGSGCINISIIDDAEQEMTEEFNATVYVFEHIYSTSQCTPVLIRITDNDGIVVCCHLLYEMGYMFLIFMAPLWLHRYRKRL